MKVIRINPQTKSPLLDLALDTIHINKQALIFVNTKKSAEKQAEDIAKKTKLSDQEKAYCLDLADKVLKVLSRPTKQCLRQAACIRGGTAFHHSGLAPKQRELIENSFREGKLKIICCTPTLAMGLDLPAFRSIIKDLKRFGPRGMAPIPVLEYLQQAGRAGRPKYEDYGECICIASSEGEKDAIIERYVNGEPESIYSKLASEPVLRTYVLSLIATRFVNRRSALISFFEKTFWAYQFRDMGRLESIIDHMLHLLREWDFVSFEPTWSDHDIQPTYLGQRVAQLYLDPLTAHDIITALERAKGRPLHAISFLQLFSLTLEIRPRSSVRAKDMEVVQDALIEYEENFITQIPSMYDPDYEDYLSSVKLALCLHSWIEERDEEYLLDRYNITPGELRVKLDIADWLCYSTVEMAKATGQKSYIYDLNRVRMRLMYGAREELLPLLRLKQIGRVRARKLYNDGIHNIGDVKVADFSRLLRLVGPAVATTIKNQVGDKRPPIKTSLKDY